MTSAGVDLKAPHNWRMPKRFTLTTPQLLDAVEELEGERLNDRTLGNWAARGVVEPSVVWHRKAGRHHARLYSLDDLALVRLVLRLKGAGLSMQRIAAALSTLDRRDLTRGLKSGRGALVIEGWRGRLELRGTRSAEGGVRVRLKDVTKRNEEVAGALTETE